jgi:hypothetical protein
MTTYDCSHLRKDSTVEHPARGGEHVTEDHVRPNSILLRDNG